MEPNADPARRSGVSSLPPAGEHARHDRLLVVRHAAGDLDDPAEVVAAAALVASCGACAALGAELGAIAGAFVALPAPVRPRDLRLSPAQLRDARPGVGSRLLGRIGALRAPALQPFAGAVAVAGIVLAVAGGLAPVAPTPTAPVPSEAEVTVRRAAAPSPAAADIAASAMVVASPDPAARIEAADPATTTVAADPAATTMAADVSPAEKAATTPATGPGPAFGGPLAIVGALLAAGAIVVLVLVRLARRAGDPLLR